jgi:phosphoserine aminotransferase
MDSTTRLELCQQTDKEEHKNMRKVFNFSAGPAMLPEEVLLQAQAEMLDWQSTGMSIMELGHRGPEFKIVAEQAEADLRELMDIPKNYHVLFVAGGATTQFAMVPLNLLKGKRIADYVDTGIWSKKAIDEASCYGSINVVTKTAKHEGLFYIPSQSEWSLNPEASYLHFTPNETIEGIEFHWLPQTGNVPLVADMTSMILSRPINVRDYGVIYAGAQKNIGQAGISVVIVRDDLVTDPLPGTPTLYNYKIQAEHHSFYNTPPTYSWYIAGLVLAWMKRKGGVKVFSEMNQRKAKKLYSFIDTHKDFYVNNVRPDCRSIMNVPFNIVNETLNETFLEMAEQAGLTNLKGHRIAGGMRASMYNAMPEEGVDALIDFMKEFMRIRG